jgi:hypothetical protein
MVDVVVSGTYTAHERSGLKIPCIPPGHPVPDHFRGDYSDGRHPPDRVRKNFWYRYTLPIDFDSNDKYSPWYHTKGVKI